jgi:hypothetical protein
MRLWRIKHKYDPQRIFIMGMPRTGTSVMGELLKQHPKIIYFHEDPKNYPTSRKVEGLLRKGCYIAQKFPQKCMELESLYKEFPTASYILMTRDILATTRSYRAYPKSEGDGKYPRALAVEGVIDPYDIHWKYRAVVYTFTRRYRSNVMKIKLEDLIRHTSVQTLKIFNLIGLKVTSSVSDFMKYIRDEQVPDYPEQHAKSFVEKKIHTEAK